MTEEQKTMESQEKDFNQDQQVYSKEEVEKIKKEMASNSEKGVQKVISEKKVYQQAMEEISNVANDNTHLVNLFNSKPEVAKVILDTVYDGQSIEDFKKEIGYEENFTDSETIKKLVQEEARVLSENQKIEDAKKDFIQSLNIEGENLQKFETAFAERRELKSFSLDTLDTQLTKAYREFSDDTEAIKTIENDQAIAKTLATGQGSYGGDTKDIKHQKTQDEAKSFVNTFIN